VDVKIMVDALGSRLFPLSFFKLLVGAGAEIKFFNPLRLWRFGVRDHRKLLICDDEIAFVGGFNISDEYNGDGVTCGWCDLGACIESAALLEALTESFDGLFVLADFHRKPLLRLRVFKRKRKSHARAAGKVLLSHPGLGWSPFQRALHRDFAAAREIKIISAYFLPTRRLRRDLRRAARRGVRVQLILAGKTDVPVAQLAARSFFQRLLNTGVEIYEYQPQILHAKLIVSDRAAYVGSSNLDVRSLNLNYELMLRFEDEKIVAGAREIFENTLKNSCRVEVGQWRESRTFWQRWKERWAHFLLARIDPFIALRQFDAMKK
ncbi:MAG: phospholipase D-like domain-containing protein, partial [Limisphaerales bacterium]